MPDYSQILFRRGNSSANVPTAVPAGEPYWTTDNKLYIGTGTSRVLINDPSAVELPDVGTVGTYIKVTTDAKGRVISGLVAIAESDVTGLVSDLAAKAPLASPTFTGAPKAPTAALGTNTTQLATTAFVKAEIDSVIEASDAMIFKGTIATTGGTLTPTAFNALTNYKAGWTYKVAEAGVTLAGVKCEIGDTIMSTVDRTTPFTAADWYVVQANIDGAVTGPASSVANRIAIFSGTTGKVIADSGKLITDFEPVIVKLTAFNQNFETSTSNIKMNGTASVGVSNNIPRADHVHPTDTTRAPLASPALTGTPTAPTATAGTNTTQIATTAYVQSELAADLGTAVPKALAGTGAVGTAVKFSREDHVHPFPTVIDGGTF